MEEIKKEANQWTFNNDDEWYTCTIDVERFLDNTMLSKNLTYWLPFDKNDSAFCKVLTRKGFKFYNTHIENGQDFYTYEPTFEYDVIISNPPFKGKANLIRRLNEIKKPFALIFGIQCFSSGGFTKELSKVEDIGMIFIQKRMKFHKGDETIKLSAPTFHSMWITSLFGRHGLNEYTIDFIVEKSKNE